MSSEFSELARMLRESDLSKVKKRTSLDDIFVEEPCPLPVFLYDKKFLNFNIELSDTQFRIVQLMERVYFDGWDNSLGEWAYDPTKDLYSQMGEVMDPYWRTKVPMVNKIVTQWGKGSKSPETPIYDAKTGRWTKLRDFKAGSVASAYPTDGKVFSALGTTSFKEGVGAMYRVRTKKGLVDEVWGGHRYLTWSKRRWVNGTRVKAWSTAGKYGADWSRLRDMQVGDPIAVSRFVPEPTHVIPQLDHDVEMIGLLLGDGAVAGSYHGMMTVGKDAPITLQKCIELYGMFDNTSVVSDYNISDGSVRIHVKPIECDVASFRTTYSRAVRKLCDDFSLSGHTCFTKSIPDVLYSLDNRQVALLLSRLIDTDGWVSFSNTPEIGFCSVSKELAVGVQRLMLRLGALAEIKVKKGTCQNCKFDIEGHVSPHLSYQVRVRDRKGLQALSSVLTLLDKAPQIVRLQDWLLSKIDNNQKAEHGDLVWDHIESIEYVGEGEYWTLSVDGPASYISSNGILDHNSGKDTVGTVSVLRVAYLLLCLRSPQAYFGKPASDQIHMLNVAPSAPIARDVFFAPLKEMAETGWFAGKSHITMNAIEFPKNITAISGNSDAKLQEGKNLIVGIADEIDGFQDAQTRSGNSRSMAVKSAESILNMLHTSSSSRYPLTYKNLIMSFPAFKGGPIQRWTGKYKGLIKEDEEDETRKIPSRYFVSGPLATWEVNPSKTKAMFAEDYRENPTMATSMYECKPSAAITPFFYNTDIVKDAFVKVDPYPLVIPGYIQTANAWAPVYEYADSLVPIRGAIYALHADMAKNGDRAGIAMSHVAKMVEYHGMTRGENNEEIEVREARPLVKVDFAIAFTADPSAQPPRDIQIRWARELVFDLIKKGFNVQKVTYDRFESLDSMQQLEDRGLISERLSLDLNPAPWNNLRDLMNESRVVIPFDQTVIDELLGLNVMQNGKVDHGPASSKDIGDGLAGSVMGALSMGGEETESGERSYYGQSMFASGSVSDEQGGTPYGFSNDLMGYGEE